ncbi:MAG: hypothetical protein HY658_05625 [Actinobacteria bacterium]|nr:hypothetical protein [Actinomycetota bacterium]
MLDPAVGSPLLALVALVLLAVPGAALSVAAFGPGRLPATTRLALVLPLGYAVAATVALALALAGVLSAPSFMASLAVATIALVAVAWRWRDLRGQPSALRRELSDEPVLAALAVLVPAAVMVSRLLVPEVLNLGDYTPFRYWSDGLEVAAAGGIPARSMQWGEMLPTATSKVGLNSFHGAMALVLGRGPFAPMGALLAVSGAALAGATLAFGRELGLRYTAALLPILLFANLSIGNVEQTLDLSGFRAEAWGRVTALAAAALAVRAMRTPREGSWLPEALAAGGLLGLGATTHLVPTAVVGGLFLAYGAARAAVDRRVVPVLRAGAVVAATAAVLGGAVLVAAPGDPGFRGPGNPGVYAELARELGFPPSFDPTLYLARGELDQEPRTSTSAFYVPPSETVERFSESIVGSAEGTGPPGWAVLLAAAVALGVVMALGTPDLRAAAAGTAAFGIGLLLVALAFSHRYDVFALAMFGERRLFDYTAVVGWLLLLAVVETGAVRLRGRVPVTATAVVTLAVAAVLVPASIPREREERLVTAVPALEWIAENVPCDGRVLADRRTLGTFEATTGRIGVIEGMGPYFRIPVLKVALARIVEAREFLAGPLDDSTFLAKYDVAVVVVTSTGGGLLGGASRLTRVARDRLANATFLEEVLATETVTVYRVLDFDGGTPPPPGTPFCHDGASP